jgi:hypothetical protein
MQTSRITVVIPVEILVNIKNCLSDMSKISHFLAKEYATMTMINQIKQDNTEHEN